jgi:vancomycin resistance protein VanJ
MPISAEQSTPPRSRRGASLIVAGGSLVVALLLVAHSWVPDIAGAGLLLDSGLIWLGAAVPALALLALFARRKRVAVLVLVPAVIWSLMFVPGMVPLAWFAPAATEQSLSVASQNIKAQSGTGVESARALAATGANVVAVQEIDAATRGDVKAVLDAHYDYSYQVGTVGLWSSYPLLNPRPQSFGLGWNRALSAELDTPDGPVSIYVVHAASARPSDHTERDTMLANIAATIAGDHNKRIIAVGDFNAAATDRHFTPITAQLSEANQDQGLAGFTWPATPFPVTRLDHVLSRGMAVTSSTVFSAGDSDHRAILARMNL